MTDVLGIVAVIVLIAANGYFVAAEFAYVAARRQSLVAAADAGDRKSRRAVAVHRRLSFMLSGAQLGITVTSLVLGFVARPAIAEVITPVVEWLGLPAGSATGVSIAIAFVLATVAQMVFGELAPKNLAIAKPEPVARAVAGSTLVYMKVAGPVIRLFDGSANRLLRLLGIEPVEELHGAVSVHELDLIVEQSAAEGHLTPSQAALLDRAIDFGGLAARDAMVPWHRVDTVSIDDDLDAMLADLVRSRRPVLDVDGSVAGLVLVDDLLGAAPRGVATAADLVRPIVAVPEAASLTSVLSVLRERHSELALVVDEYGGPAGIITLEDLVEELVGDIEDEHDTRSVVAAVAPAGDGAAAAWTARGVARPDEIERATGLSLPDGDYETVAGLVMHELERLAAVGDVVVVGDVRIEVTGVDGYSVSEVLLSVVEPGRATSPADPGDDRPPEGR